MVHFQCKGDCLTAAVTGEQPGGYGQTESAATLAKCPDTQTQQQKRHASAPNELNKLMAQIKFKERTTAAATTEATDLLLVIVVVVQ